MTARPRSKGRYRTDRAIVGRGAVIKCVSASASDWAALDEAALRVQMSRSHFVRQAVKYFIAKLADGGTAW